MQRQRLWKGLARAMTGETFPQSFGSKVSAYDSLVLLLENHVFMAGLLEIRQKWVGVRLKGLFGHPEGFGFPPAGREKQSEV